MEVMNDLCEGKSIPLNFEDIVVAVFKRYPNEFHLRGYTKYPDAVGINISLYGHLKKYGYVTSGNKRFQLTKLGLNLANKNKGNLKSESIKFDRDLEYEINRIMKLDAFDLFIKNEDNKILDSDFYNYVGVTVSTPKNIFLGKLNTLKLNMNNLIKIKNDPLTSKIHEFHKFMLSRFKNEIPKG